MYVNLTHHNARFDCIGTDITQVKQKHSYYIKLTCDELNATQYEILNICYVMEPNVGHIKWALYYNDNYSDIIQLNIENTIIERVYEFNFLGLNINENLDKIANKISKSMCILNKLKHFLSLNAKLLIYSALISSYLNFGILA